jgi:hypothetical protein
MSDPFEQSIVSCEHPSTWSGQAPLSATQSTAAGLTSPRKQALGQPEYPKKLMFRLISRTSTTDRATCPRLKTAIRLRPDRAVTVASIRIPTGPDTPASLL